MRPQIPLICQFTHQLVGFLRINSSYGAINQTALTSNIEFCSYLGILSLSLSFMFSLDFTFVCLVVQESILTSRVLNIYKVPLPARLDTNAKGHLACISETLVALIKWSHSTLWDGNRSFQATKLFGQDQKKIVNLTSSYTATRSCLSMSR